VRKIDREKIQLFTAIFSGRSDCYGSEESGCVKENITDEVIWRHLMGQQRIGVYPLIDGSKTWWIAADFDDDNLDKAKSFRDKCCEHGIPTYIERSKSKGYHCWIWFTEPVEARQARALVRQILADLGSDFSGVEVFPKQDSLDDNRQYGNYINLPLFGRSSADDGRTVFVNPDDYQPYSSQWAFLQNIERVTPEKLEEIVGSFNTEDDTASAELVTDANADTLIEYEASSGANLGRVLECKFIQHCRDNAAELREPLWYAMISNLCRCDGGSEKIHELSRPHSEYSESKTNEKIKHALAGSGPITCQKIRDDGFACPKDCSVKSPAGLARRTDIKSMIEQIPEDADKMELPELLKPSLRLIAALEPAERRMHLHYLVKPRFGLTRDDMKAYEKTVAGFVTEVPEDDAPPEMTDEEREEAMAFLRQPDLMERTIADQTSIGIVGENEVKGLVYLSYTSRKSPEPISLELRAPSGVGKSHMVVKTTLLMPPEDVIKMTRITARYLDYLREDSLVGKIFIVMERPGSEDAGYSVRMLTDDTASGICVGYLKKDPATGEFEPAEKTVRGPLVFIQTSTSLDANPENESRIFCVYLDDGMEQRQVVQEAVKLSYLPHRSLSESDREAIMRRHRNAQRLLEPSPVAIPYVNLIEFPIDKSRSIRDMKRFLNLVKTSAFYHQFQRRRCEIEGVTYVIAEIRDYAVAYGLARKVLVDALSDLNPSSRELLVAATEIKREKERLIAQGGDDAPKDAKFTRRDLERRPGWDKNRVHRAIGPLEAASYFGIEKIGRAYRYELICDEDLQERDLKGVLTPEELNQRRPRQKRLLRPVVQIEESQPGLQSPVRSPLGRVDDGGDERLSSHRPHEASRS